jgi:hypothetical protein
VDGDADARHVKRPLSASRAPSTVPQQPIRSRIDDRVRIGERRIGRFVSEDEELQHVIRFARARSVVAAIRTRKP